MTLQQQVIKFFIRAAATGILTLGVVPENLKPIPLWFWENLWHAANSALGARSAIGAPQGATPDTPNDRVMESFGTKLYPSPLLVTDAALNAPKGWMFGLISIISQAAFQKLAYAAVKEDSDKVVADLLTLIQDAFTVFEYNEDVHVRTKRNEVLRQVALQLRYIEQDTGISNLETWWWVWAADFLQHAADTVQGGLAFAVRSVARIYIAANNHERLKTF
ncbi:hypothetical protein BDW60DRAFT_210322 [Aspergillus nidulans var. acristatus]